MDYVLGLDLGARSLGWAAIATENGSESQLLGLGVRIFEAGVVGSIEDGREDSRGVKRRTARLARRQARRRRQRSRVLYRELAGVGLLPPIEHRPGKPLAMQIQNSINDLDCELRAKYEGNPAIHQLPYLLRARAASEEPLTAYELGRALYHLGQRRGFLSNRKAKAKTDQDNAEEKSKVYGEIRSLTAELEHSGRTLGEYLASLDPQEQRLRNRYTHRRMYQQEFTRIWEMQRPHHASLTEEFRKKIEHLLFWQHPLRDSDDLVGDCEWIPGEKRAPKWSPEYQRFRILQTVNHLRVADARKTERALTPTEREMLADRLSSVRQLSLKQAKTLLGIPSNHTFTLQEGGETKLVGDAVGPSLKGHLGVKWEHLSDEERVRFLENVAACESDEELAVLLMTEFSIPEANAAEITEKLRLPEGYASLSLKALRAVLPWMKQGKSVQEARQAAGFELQKQVPVHDLLPPLETSGIDVRNPAVFRSLTELRKVVNAAVQKWGKPAEIHIEVARELKKTREARKKETARMRAREKERDNMRALLETEIGLPRERIGRKEIELGLLYQECGGHCPYTGQPLGSLTALFAGTSEAQIEHIIPRSISLDDSFENLTLASAAANARKANRTPRQAFPDSAEFEQIIERVMRFGGNGAVSQKLARFRMTETETAKLLDDFTERHLNDTRYGSRLASEYVSLLYGGEVVGGKRKVFKVTGQITADLRSLWNLNSILGGDGRKSRDDHRHHAIDAAVIAVIRQKWVTALSEAAARAYQERKRRYASISPPWVGFREDVAAAAAETHVSYRPDHRLTGALHKETFYTPSGQNARGKQVVRTRKPVHRLTAADIEAIVDDHVRKCVQAKLVEVGGDPAKLENNWPKLPNANGAPVDIKKVRIQLIKTLSRIGDGWKTRYAERSETHHMAVYEVTRGNRRIWDSDVVPVSGALDRKRQGEPVVDRTEPDGRGFLFSISKNDVLELTDTTGERTGFWVVRKLASKKQLCLVAEHDAHREERQKKTYNPSVNGLKKLNARKVVIGPLGDISVAHD